MPTKLTDYSSVSFRRHFHAKFRHSECCLLPSQREMTRSICVARWKEKEKEVVRIVIGNSRRRSCKIDLRLSLIKTVLIYECKRMSHRERRNTHRRDADWSQHTSQHSDVIDACLQDILSLSSEVKMYKTVRLRSRHLILALHRHDT